MPYGKYLRTHTGLEIFTGYKEIAIHIPNDSAPILIPLIAHSIYESKDGTIWCGLHRNGIIPLTDGNTPDETRHYLQGYSVSDILEDSEGGFWFTTLENGVFYMASEKFLYYSIEDNHLVNRILCLTPADSAHVLAGTANGSIYRADPFHISLTDNSRNTSISRIYTGIHSPVLVGSDSSYILQTGNHKKIIPICLANNKIAFTSFAITSKGEVWGGNYLFLARIDPVSGLVEKKITVKSRILSLYCDAGDRIWMGCSDGLWKYEKDSLFYMSLHTPLLQCPVEDLKQSKDGSWWYATKGNGVIIRNGDKLFQISVKNRLTSNICRSLDFDPDGNVWIGTNAGINKIIPLVQGNFKIENYTSQDGLYSNEINQLVINGDYLWAASNIGILFFNTRAAFIKRIPPPVYITNFDVNNRKTDFSTDAELDHTQSFIRINFIGLSYKRGTGLVYKYRLQGLDTAWNYTTGTSIQYTPLPPGSYTFSVYAVNSDGMESVVPAT
ncbi:MAG TPA: two-component regulator propeller domain-containing protein, partial [Bacteroidia bacterium]|nr:two-component regulator propeller domain-containing protein [Bacteroidia bacterium]